MNLLKNLQHLNRFLSRKPVFIMLQRSCQDPDSEEQGPQKPRSCDPLLSPGSSPLQGARDLHTWMQSPDRTRSANTTQGVVGFLACDFVIVSEAQCISRLHRLSSLAFGILFWRREAKDQEAKQKTAAKSANVTEQDSVYSACPHPARPAQSTTTTEYNLPTVLLLSVHMPTSPSARHQYCSLFTGLRLGKPLSIFHLHPPPTSGVISPLQLLTTLS